MLEVGETAPTFRLPKVDSEAYKDAEPFSLAAAVGDGPVVLAFIPAAFARNCTTELCTFRDSIHRFDELDAQVYGISVDIPPAQSTFIAQEELTFPMLSDWDHEAIEAYGVVTPDRYGGIETATRSIFVLDSTGTVSYRWVESDGETDFGAVVDAVEGAVAETVDAESTR